MNSRKLLKDLSANAVQTGVTQVAALVIFYIISRYISKENFGDYNWSTAVGSTIIAIASLGLDLVFVKRVASGQDVKVMTGIHFFHTLFTGLLLTGVLLGLQLVLPNLLQYHALFPLVFFNLVIANIANSFKFCLTGLEEFRLLALVSICTNLLKLAVVIGLFIAGRFDIRLIVTGFLAVSVVEFLISYYFVSRRISHQVRPVFIVIEYRRFIYESLPQLGVVLFDSALARVDWILLGVMSTSAVTAEYSFAYKFFELSKLPLLILAPVLLTRFSRLYQKDEPLNGQTAGNIRSLFRLEMFIALLIPVFMICAWTPLIDYVTDNKYGAVNQVNFTILAFCIPLHYVINFLWTMGFVQGQLKLIMYITIGVSVFNLLANMLLIPRYGSLGAAIAFLAGTLIQFTAYLLLIRQDRLKLNLKPVLVSYFNGLVALGIVYYTGIPAFAAAFLALGIYLLLSLLTGQVSPAMFRNLTKATPHS